MARKKKAPKTDVTKPAGKSKYALKVARRKKMALFLEFPPNTPWPILWENLGNK